jgi:CO/xanthine dehydrogenase FAD-binding subunit
VRRPDEILTEISLGWKSTYWKLPAGADFPVLGVVPQSAFRDLVEEARISLGAVASRPFLVEKANQFLKGKKLTDDVIEEASRLVASRAKPMDNADLDPYWRKDVTAQFAAYALRELRGDDMRDARLRTARHVLQD